MIWKKLPPRVYWFGLGIIIFIGAAFYFFIGIEAKTSVSDQFTSRQELLVRAEANNITSFINSLGDSVAVLSNLSSMERRDSSTERDLNSFIQQRKSGGVIGGVIYADEDGKVIFNSNVIGTPDIGGDVSDRDYFAWAKAQTKEGEYFVGQPVVSRLGASEGKTIVVVASPVFKGDEFLGVLGVSVELDGIAQHYLEVMKVADNTDVYLIRSDGTVLYDNFNPAAIGSNISQVSSKLKGLAASTKVGSKEMAYRDPVEGKMEQNLVAYAPVDFGERKWTLIMASPVSTSDLWGLAIPMYVRVIILLVLISATLFLFGIVTVEEVRTKYVSSPKSSSKPQKRL